MKNLVLIIAVLIGALGCDRADYESRQIDRELEKTYTTTAYNYTPYDLFSIMFDETSKPFRADKAAGAGSVFSRTASKTQLDNGVSIFYMPGGCCLIWNKSITQPLRVRVVWSVVFDRESFDGKNRPAKSERYLRRGGLGNRWCEALVDIQPPRHDEKPDMVIFHFFPNGSVEAHLGTDKTSAPLVSSYLGERSKPLPAGHYCIKEIDNPWFGIPLAPHRE